MANTILGLSALYHDSAAALVRDGEIIAAAQEERFSRKKHDPRFPVHAIRYCLEEAFIEPRELTAVAYYDNPLLTLDRVLKSLLTAAPKGEEQWAAAARNTLGVKLFVSDQIKTTLGVDVPIYFSRHHHSHAASAFYPSPYSRAAILTMDGVGEWTTTSIGKGEGNAIELLKDIQYPHSLGLLYSACTSFCGFKVNSGEYKLMGLAPYGRPRYADVIRDKLISVKSDGSFRLDTSYFGYLDSKLMTNERFHALFGGPPRAPESHITAREMDLAASIQVVTEEIVLALARHARELTGMEDLVLAGGVALNCVANGRLLREGPFKRLWIQPASGDAGGALGAALLTSHRAFGAPRRLSPTGRDTQKGSYLGPRYSSDEVRAFLDRWNYPHELIEDSDARARRIAEFLAGGKVVGFLAGRMEFGPRSLGARSILGDPRLAETQVVMNLKIKYRESFRPFAPSVLAEKCVEQFELEGESPYMLLVAPVVKEKRLPFDLPAFQSGADDMLEVVRQPRSGIPAVTHVDYSARIQTVHQDDHPDYHRVLRAFEAITGCPVLVNTSFNVRGEPIVCTPKDAYLCFMRTEMDALVLENCILLKDQQPPHVETSDWRKEHVLD